jgi:hypothetical protein
MTIAIAIRTNTAAVLAADSKLTTRGLIGFDENNEPQFVNQTYDNATKIVADASGCVMAVLAGSATMGPISVMDYIASSSVPEGADDAKQESAITDFAEGMAKIRAAYWAATTVTPDKWPVTAVILAAAPAYSKEPIIWHLAFLADKVQVNRIRNRVYLDGSYDGAYALLYGYRSDVIDDLAGALKIGEQAVGADAVYDALNGTKVIRPIDKLSLPVMPLQDAVDLAVFLATTQVQIERFLPGEPYCGGPIDVMILKSAPKREIIWLPGKTLRHPVVR